jgi:hypothetical protein
MKGRNEHGNGHGGSTTRQARIAEARRLRAEDGLSKSQIAERLGVSTGLLSKWLQGVDPPAWTKRPDAKDDLRELRRQHRSVPEIASELGIVKSTGRELPRLPGDHGAAQSGDLQHDRGLGDRGCARFCADVRLG